MARFSFSTGILSPLNSDISLNDISAFSFGSPTTPDCDKSNKNNKKDSVINSFCEKGIKESANVFQITSNDVKKQFDTNAEREEKFKESYDTFKQSMDELFYNKSYSSILSPISKDIEKESFTCEKKLNADVNTNKMGDKSQDFKKDYEKVSTSPPETCPQISSKKTERKKKVSFSTINKEQRPKDDHLTNINSLKQPTDNSGGTQVYKHKTSKKSSASDKPLETKQATSTKSTKYEAKVKDFQFKCQQKIATSNNMPTTENKGLSIQKSIEIAVGMEMDNIRNLILNQNAALHKELFKLQDIAQKQAATTKYLFSVIDELLETNKKLIAKNK